jgi:hypothetical protein
MTVSYTGRYGIWFGLQDAAGRITLTVWYPRATT